MLSQWVAYHLSQLKQQNILSIFTEKDEKGDQILSRGFDKLVIGKKILVVEDFTTTGASVKSCADSIKAAGGMIKEICVIINREPKKVNTQSMGYSFSSLGVFEVESWSADECPLCKRNIPINPDLGHGKEFLSGRR